MNLKHFIFIAIFFAFLFVYETDFIERNTVTIHTPLSLNDTSMSVNEKINTLSITYRLSGNEIPVTIYTPENFDHTKSYPTIVIAHHNSQAAEPLEALYARRFAARGYMSMTTNSAFYEINHHNTELVSTDLDRTDGIHGMVSYIRQYMGNNNPIGVLRIRHGKDCSLTFLNTHSATILPYQPKKTSYLHNERRQQYPPQKNTLCDSMDERHQG
jgi:hypothetical protein|tara:strand:- start:1326 stop:1967 length:642 start_codon:yes stop_codon:yes gene_type:complete